MIEIVTLPVRNTPMLYCDICGQPIRDASEAAAVFDGNMDEGKRTVPLHVHKGTGNKACFEKAEAIILSTGGTVDWRDLRTHLVLLVSNIGFPPAAMDDFERNDGFNGR